MKLKLPEFNEMMEWAGVIGFAAYIAVLIIACIEICFMPSENLNIAVGFFFIGVGTGVLVANCLASKMNDAYDAFRERRIDEQKQLLNDWIELSHQVIEGLKAIDERENQMIESKKNLEQPVQKDDSHVCGPDGCKWE